MPTESKVPVASTATVVDAVNVCLYKGQSQSSPWPSNRVEVGGKSGEDTDTEQKIKSLGHNRELRTEHSSPQRFIARPSKRGLRVEEGDAPFTIAQGGHEEDGSHQKRIKRGRTRTKKEAKRGAAVSRKRQRKVTDESTDEEDEGGAPKIPWRQQNKKVCVSTGCTNKANRAGGLCHKHFASSSVKTKKVKKKSPPIAPGMKPLFKVGSKVYAAYWSDKSRKSKNPSFYPGVVSSFLCKKAADFKYGYARYYNIQYDDGDTLDNVSDRYVFDAEDYLLHMRHDNDTTHIWLGVRNVVDSSSQDAWAANVGWYVASIDGQDRSFSLLSSALRAYDTCVIRQKGMAVKESELNLPEDVFGKDDDTAESDDEDAGGGPKILRRQQTRKCCKSQGCSNKARRAGGLCDRHFARIANPDNAGDLKAETENKSTNDCDGVLPETFSPQSPVEGIPLPPQGVFTEGLSSGVERTCNYEGCNVNVSKGERCRRHKVCSYEGCESLVVKLGLCGKHGGRPPCSYEGCSHLARKSGLCITHLKHLDPNYTKKEIAEKRQSKSGTTKKSSGGTRKVCSIEGCKSLVVKLGLCGSHGGRPPCRFEGCIHLARKSGLCTKHWDCKSESYTKTEIKRTCDYEGCTVNISKGERCYRHRVCSFEGCSHLARKSGLCTKHWNCQSEFGGRRVCSLQDVGDNNVYMTDTGRDEIESFLSRTAQSVANSHTATVRPDASTREAVLCQYGGCIHLAECGGKSCTHHRRDRGGLCNFPGCLKLACSHVKCRVHIDQHVAEMCKQNQAVKGSHMNMVEGYHYYGKKCTAGSTRRCRGIDPSNLANEQAEASTTACNHPQCTNIAHWRGKCELHSQCSHPECTNKVRKNGKCGTHQPTTTCNYPECNKIAHRRGKCELHDQCSHPECTNKSWQKGKCRRHIESV